MKTSVGVLQCVKLVLIFLESNSMLCKMQQGRINLKEVQMFYYCEEQLIDCNLQMLPEYFS